MRKKYSLPNIRLNMLLTRIDRSRMTKSLDFSSGEITEDQFEMKAIQAIDHFKKS